jgi:hypothetical protein
MLVNDEIALIFWNQNSGNSVNELQKRNLMLQVVVTE